VSSSFKIFIQVFLIVFLTYFTWNTLINLPEFQLISGNGEWNITVGSMLYLPLGSWILVYLLYRERALIGLFTVTFMAGIYYDLEEHLMIGFTLINTFGPMLAIHLLEKFHLADYKNFGTERIPLGHIFFLTLTVSIINTLSKFTIYYWDLDFTHAHSIWEDQGSINFLISYLPGDIIGSTVFILIAILFGKLFNLQKLRVTD